MAAIQGLESQLDSLTFTWRKGPNAPSKMFNGTCTAHGKKAYFSGWNSTVVYEFDAESSEWLTLPDCPHNSFSLTIVDGRSPYSCRWENVDKNEQAIELQRQKMVSKISFHAH